ncbi:HNH endonuclease [Streptomyces melanosporofaciens]
MAVSKRLRYEVLRRDSHTCRYCGATAPDVPLRIDHVTPVALGGSDEPGNLVTACQDCNSGKSSATVDSAIVANVSDDALRWAAAMTQAADNLLEQEAPKLEYRDAFLAEWNRRGHGDGKDRKAAALPGDWKTSVERFRIAGLPVWMWADIVDASMGNEKVLEANKFKYCCGIAWNRVTELQVEARRIIDPSAARPDLATLPAALIAVSIEVWRHETGEGLTSEQLAELRAGVVEAVENGIDADDIIEAAKHAAWSGHAGIPEGLADVEAEARHMGSLDAWEAAWMAGGGERPSSDAFKVFTETCSALAKAGATSKQLHRAATFAGSHLTPHLYFGLEADHLKAVKVEWKRQRAVDFWAASTAASTGRWPSAEQRRAVNESIDCIRNDGGFGIFDLWAAAAAAGAYEDTDLSTLLTRNLSVFEAAAQPLAGGVN